jgi:signal transduction histidine kinase/DNA-binding response OmpR family regulator/CHASE3 domain sensor protein
MNLGNVKIAKQLTLGLGIILFLTGLLAVLSWWQNVVLWQPTKDLYQHPLTVRRALSDFRADVLYIQRDLKDLCLGASETSFTSLVHDISRRDDDGFRQLGIMRVSYLGPAEDVARLRRDFQQWQPIREETLRMVKDGKRAEATARVIALGADNMQVEAVLAELQIISDFAFKMGDKIIRDAEELYNTSNHQLLAAMVAILFVSLLVAAMLLRGIRTPLADLTAATLEFRHGRLDARAHYVSDNEFGVLASSFNAMADAIHKEMRGRESAALIASALLREDEAHGFCRELLKALLAHTHSQVGAVYLLNEAKTEFVHCSSIGLDMGGRADFPAAELSGELGAAVATRQIQRITDIPADTRFTFTAVSGGMVPREILTIPVVSGDHVSALVSLASVHAYTEAEIQVVHDVWGVLTARANGVLAFQRIHNLAGKLEAQNRELDQQRRELSSQTSELVEQNAELEMQKREIGEANRLKSQFVSNMSHELRTPLNSVIALSSVLHRRLAGKIPSEEFSFLEVIERNGKNLLELINDILDLSRIEAGREDVRIQTFSMGALVEELVPVLAPLARDKALVLDNRVPADLPLLSSDPDKCRHILQNLLGNAIKFTAQGHVSMDAHVSADSLEISVSDTGIGIAEDKQDIIFQEFRQADESMSRKYGGSGLGLSIARKYARMLGGDLTVRSTLGQGATFTLRLPLAALAGSAAPTAEPRPRKPVGAAPVGQGQCILVVEDSEPAIIQLTDILKVDGYRVQVARNGKAALEGMAKTLPDAVVLDLMMPEVDGFQVLRQLRSSPRTDALPVLILTARHVSREELSFLTGNHIHQLIQKGDVDRASLLAAVAEMVTPARPAPAPPLMRKRRIDRNGKPVVLVVEDNLDNLRTMKALIESDYHVVEARDGREGLALARRHAPDIILMDIALPELDGIAALAEIRREETLRDIIVFAVTASAMTGDREKILAHGFDGYISKPIEHGRLMETLRGVFDV